jgi:predicted dehydrogenase
VEINNHNITLEIDQFVDALANGTALPVTSMEGAKTVAVCRACVESAATHALVQVKYPNV